MTANSLRHIESDARRNELPRHALLDKYDDCWLTHKASAHAAVNLTDGSESEQKISLKGNIMKKTSALFTRMALAVSMLAGAVAPLNAAPVVAPIPAASTTDVVQVNHRNRFERQGNRVFLNGNRGYRNQRRGFREYNGFWFPASAFLGAIIIGEVLNGPRVIRRDGSHVRWCSDRYRSYRASSNSYQPYNGPRRICYSPYN